MKNIDCDSYLTYGQFTKRVIKKKQISWVNRITVTKEIKTGSGNKNVIFDNERCKSIRIFRLPIDIEEDWEEIAKAFVKTI